MARFEVDDDGIPGLTLALRLRLKGHDVALSPVRTPAVLDGTFTLPAPYRDLLLKSGGPLETSLPLTPAVGRTFRLDGLELVLPHVGPHSTAIGEALGATAGRQWAALIRVAADIWGTLRTGAYVSSGDLPSLARQHLHDQRLRQLLDAYVEPHGLTPSQCGDAAVVLPYLDQTFGCWQFESGLQGLTDELRRRCSALGVVAESNAGEHLSTASYWTSQLSAPKRRWRSRHTDPVSSAALGLPWVGMAADFVAERVGRA